ncbi:MAG: hypothetical protein RL076_2604 [Chloroflexota bacterium]
MCACVPKQPEEVMTMPKKTSRPWLWAVWLGVGVVVVRAGAAFFAHRERQTPTQMIDWTIAQQTVTCYHQRLHSSNPPIKHWWMQLLQR